MLDAIDRLKRELKRQGQPEPTPADAAGLARAARAGFPAELLDFYTRCVPDPCIQLHQRIWSIDSALIENEGAVPGCALSPHGFVVFVSTLCGDAYCIDTTSTNAQGRHPIVLFSHEMIDEDATPDRIRAARVQVAGSFDEFLEHFIDGTLSEDAWLG